MVNQRSKNTISTWLGKLANPTYPAVSWLVGKLDFKSDELMVFFAKNELVKVRRLSMKGVALWRWKMNKDFFHKIALFVDFEILGK